MDSDIVLLENATHTIKTSRDKIACVLFLVIISISWWFYAFNKTAPIQEGWYVVYYDLISSGMKPYVDYECLFFPLYTYIFSAIAAIFGTNLIVFRLFGVLLFIANVLLLFKICNYFLPQWASIICSASSMFLSIIDVYYVSYDYYQLEILFFFLMTICLLETEKGNRIHLLFVASGIFCALMILIRPQTLIVLCSLFAIVVVLKMFAKCKYKITDYCFFLLGLFVTSIIFVVLLYAGGMLDGFLSSAFNTESKGSSIIDLVFSFVKNFVEPYYLLLLLFIAIIVINHMGNKDYEIKQEFKLSIIGFAITVILIMMVVLIPKLTYRSILVDLNSPSLASTIVMMSAILTLLSLYILIKEKNNEETKFTTKYFFMTTVLNLAYQWNALTSGPVTYIHIAPALALTFGFVIITIFKLNNKKLISYSKIAVVLIGAMLIFTCILYKSDRTYNWWGSCEPSYEECTEEINVPHYKGIYTSHDERIIYEDYSNYVQNNLEEDDEIFCFANNQIMYHLAGKTPKVRVPINWLDVSTNSSIRSDLETIKEEPPKMIVFQDLGEYTFEVHEKIFGDKSGFKEMYDYLCYCRDSSSDYQVVREYDGGPFSSGYTIYILMRNY